MTKSGLRGFCSSQPPLKFSLYSVIISRYAVPTSHGSGKPVGHREWRRRRDAVEQLLERPVKTVPGDGLDDVGQHALVDLLLERVALVDLRVRVVGEGLDQRGDDAPPPSRPASRRRRRAAPCASSGSSDSGEGAARPCGSSGVSWTANHSADDDSSG